MSQLLKDAIRAEAQALGFDDIGFARPAADPVQGQHLTDWLSAGYHGDMSWMAERVAWRSDPAALWSQARTVIMLAENYAPNHNPLGVLETPDAAAISVYAQQRDYHDVVKKRLKRLGRWLIDRAGGEIKVFVDTAPVMEKPLAARAGLGWQGKHTNLVSRKLGSWFFLGAVFTTLDLPADGAHDDHCGGCRRCLDICPTAAFPEPYKLDATRCISYLTIELKGPIPRAYRPLIGNRIYGCDDCLAVCPWNKFAQQGHEAYRSTDDAGDPAPALADLAMLDDAAFRARFRGGPIKRIGIARFLRNVLIAIGNSGDTGLLAVVRTRLSDPDDLVRGAAVWAFARLATHQDVTAAWRPDPAPDVAAEWAAAMQSHGIENPNPLPSQHA